MLEELKDKIRNKKLILIGETHGTKEIPELLSKFFSEIAKEEDFNVCFEIPEEFQNNPQEFFKNEEIGDGKNSKEYFELIQNLKNLDNRVGIIFVVPSNARDQKELEKGIARKIRNVLDNKKTFAILGDIHASKNLFSFNGLKFETVGHILYKEFKEDFSNIRIVPKTGEFFNFGIKKVAENFSNEEFNKNFDYVLTLEKSTSCSFFGIN